MKICLGRLTRRDGLVIQSMLQVLRGMLEESWEVDESGYDLAIYDPTIYNGAGLTCPVKVALVSGGSPAPVGSLALRRPTRISQLRAILNQAALQHQRVEVPLLRSGCLQELESSLERLLREREEMTPLLTSIDGFDVVVDPQRSLCRWRFAPDLLEPLRERHNLDIRVSTHGRSCDWTPIQITTIDDFLQALAPEAKGRLETPPVWRRAIANLSMLQRIRMRLGIAG